MVKDLIIRTSIQTGTIITLWYGVKAVGRSFAWVGKKMSDAAHAVAESNPPK